MIPTLSLRAGKGKHPPPKKSSTSSDQSKSAPAPKPAAKQEQQQQQQSSKKEEINITSSTSMTTSKPVDQRATPAPAAPALIPQLKRGAKPQQQQNKQQQQHQQNTQQQQKQTTSIDNTKQQPQQTATIPTVIPTEKPSSPSTTENQKRKQTLTQTATEKKQQNRHHHQHPFLDPQTHAMSCLANLSFRLAARGHQLEELSKATSSMNSVKSLSMGVKNALEQISSEDAKATIVNSSTTKKFLVPASSTSTASNFEKQRSHRAFLMSRQIGAKVVKSALYRPSSVKQKKKKAKKSAKKETSQPPQQQQKEQEEEAKTGKKNNKNKNSKPPPKLSKFEQQMLQATSISGTTKRARIVKHKKSKRQMYEIDRNALKKTFCMTCGRPKLEGCGFRVKTVSIPTSPRKINKNTENKNTATTRKRKIIQCIFCSRLRKKNKTKRHSETNTATLLRKLIQNNTSGKQRRSRRNFISRNVPASATRQQLKRMIRRVKNKRVKMQLMGKLKAVRRSSVLTVRGHNVKDISPGHDVSRLRRVNQLRTWSEKKSKLMGVTIQRVRDRARNVKKILKMKLKMKKFKGKE